MANWTPSLPLRRRLSVLRRMAIFGPFSSVKHQIASDSRFAAAIDYVAEALQEGSSVHERIRPLAAGVTERVELAGGAFALEQAYLPKARPDGFFESHQKYIDVQVIVAGEELMEVEDIGRLAVTHPYNPERDLVKYGDTAVASLLKMRTGDVAVFFPEDGHMPSLHWRGAGVVLKTVVKVPVFPAASEKA
jgi:biofilm protein TabA